jgi:hypothetical protein
MVATHAAVRNLLPPTHDFASGYSDALVTEWQTMPTFHGQPLESMISLFPQNRS